MPPLVKQQRIVRIVKTLDEKTRQLLWRAAMLVDAFHGASARRERPRPEQFLNIELPLSSLQAQHQVVGVLARRIALKERHTAIRAANDAFIPAPL